MRDKLDELSGQAWRLMWQLSGLAIRDIRAGQKEQARRATRVARRATERWQRRATALRRLSE